MPTNSSKQSDVLIVGGGIVGAATSYYLSQHNVNSTIIERDDIASHASGFAFGGLHPRLLGFENRDMQRFSTEAFRCHETLHFELEERRENLSTWRKTSSVRLFYSLEEAQAQKLIADFHDPSTEWLDSKEILHLDSRINESALGGTLENKSAAVDSEQLTKTLVQLSGAPVVKAAVKSPLRRGNRVTGVELEDGNRIESSSVVFAMGPWSTEVFQWFDLPIMIWPLKGQILRLKVPGKPFNHSFSVDGNYMSSKPDGLVWVGTTEENAGFDEEPTNDGRNTILNIFQKMVSDFENVNVIKQTACLRPMSGDSCLILGLLPNTENAYVGTGGGRKGILYGPLMGKTIAETIVNSEGEPKWTGLSADRFSS